VKVHELGHVVLRVSDLEPSRQFYRGVLGYEEVGDTPPPLRAVMFNSPTGRTHHELLLMAEEGDTPPPAGQSSGVHHLGLKIGTTDEELRAALDELQAAGVAVENALDHTVTHSLYIRDPDGYRIELFIDVQPELWRDDPGAVMAPTSLLQL
jgi:catechol 2,3-dioxygenase